MISSQKIVQRSRHKPLVVIVGPTGIGKTSLSLHLASQFNGEIISADSRLIYRGLNIGADKPSLADRRIVPHHLIDVCNPDQTISLGQYKRLAIKAIQHVQSHYSLPFLVGGTGQYIMALVEGWKIPEVAPDERLRSVLEKLSEAELERWLKSIDPASANRIDHRNIRRVIRALEVAFKTGKPFSEFQEKVDPGYDLFMIGITSNRETIYARIDERVDNMMASGLLEEVIRLRNQDYSRSLPSMSGLGYRQLMAYLDGDITLEEAVEKIKFDTHRLVRQQSNWFRSDDERIQWFDTGDSTYPALIAEALDNWIGGKADRLDSE